MKRCKWSLARRDASRAIRRMITRLEGLDGMVSTMSLYELLVANNKIGQARVDVAFNIAKIRREEK